MHTVLWRRVDQEGHDACRFVRTETGWTIEGAAVFAQAGQAACLSYTLLCDAHWVSHGATVSGWVGERKIDLRIGRAGRGAWEIEGRVDPALAGLDDIDLGFTPASNTNAIRRLGLTEGEEAASFAVWLDTEDWCVRQLRQSYRRTGAQRFDYTSPQHGYRATLTIDSFGAVRDYPGLWSRAV